VHGLVRDGGIRRGSFFLFCGHQFQPAGGDIIIAWVVGYLFGANFRG
jgi:hypothetical protein